MRSGDPFFHRRWQEMPEIPAYSGKCIFGTSGVDSRTAGVHAGFVELETVFETLNAAEAQLIRSRLEAAGLHPQVDPEIDPLSIEAFSHPDGGVEVKVPAGEAEEARAILAASENAE